MGTGFRPCTQRAEVFDFPSADTAFLRFLDSKGLGEADYDPQEDLALCGEQAHLLLVVIKAMDHELDAVESVLRSIRQAHPEWPLLIAQTCLHEGYPHGMDHPQPYAYVDGGDGGLTPPDLLRSLRAQRERFKAFNSRFAAIDFTQPEDGFNPRLYGLEALWDAIETALPLGLRHMLLQDEAAGQVNDVYAAHARPHVIGYAISSGLLALTPVPMIGLPLVAACQGKLFHSIASIYGLPFTMRSVYEVASAVGLGSLSLGYGARELAKLAPGWGSVVSGLSTAAITYALGMTLCFYYSSARRGEAFSAEMLRAVYQRELEYGRELLRDRFK